MAEIVFEVVGRVAIELIGAAISGAIQSSAEQRRTKKPISSSQNTNRSSTLSGQHPRAVLIVSSNITFGNDCERLVNIAFQTSQMFPTMMSTYADVSLYLRQELAKQYSDQYFHIIIGRNEKFGFSVDDGQYYAEIEQDRYRVLIFTTKQNSQTKFDIHDANSQMLLVWK
jgi:hypothetical protein